MGSIVEDLPPAARMNGYHDISSFQLIDPASDSLSTSTQELLLVSWLIVLLRTREDTDIPVWFDWTVSSPSQEKGAQDEPEQVMRLSASEVMTGLDSEVGQVAAAISRHMAAMTAPRSSADPLLFSTASLSQVTEGATSKDEVSE